jgi:hypothetical protein
MASSAAMSIAFDPVAAARDFSLAPPPEGFRDDPWR